jgi:hypothetical protein
MGKSFPEHGYDQRSDVLVRKLVAGKARIHGVSFSTAAAVDNEGQRRDDDKPGEHGTDCRYYEGGPTGPREQVKTCQSGQFHVSPMSTMLDLEHTAAFLNHDTADECGRC